MDDFRTWLEENSLQKLVNSHELVKLKLANVGEKYTCPICGGCGKLLEQ